MEAHTVKFTHRVFLKRAFEFRWRCIFLKKIRMLNNFFLVHYSTTRMHIVKYCALFFTSPQMNRKSRPTNNIPMVICLCTTPWCSPIFSVVIFLGKVFSFDFCQKNLQKFEICRNFLKLDLCDVGFSPNISASCPKGKGPKNEGKLHSSVQYSVQYFFFRGRVSSLAEAPAPWFLPIFSPNKHHPRFWRLISRGSSFIDIKHWDNDDDNVAVIGR